MTAEIEAIIGSEGTTYTRSLDNGERYHAEAIKDAVWGIIDLEGPEFTLKLNIVALGATNAF